MMLEKTLVIFVKGFLIGVLILGAATGMTFGFIGMCKLEDWLKERKRRKS